jgi:hypothetical protein
VEDGRGGVSEPATVRITVQPVNDAPSFRLDDDSRSANVNETRTEVGWAEEISPGASNETGDVLTFQVSVDPPGLFTAGPSISSDGTLTFTTGALDGEAIVTVRLMDDRGASSGPQTFEIDISGGGDD